MNDANELRNTVSMMQPGDRKSEDLAEWQHARSFRETRRTADLEREARNQDEGASKEALEGVSVENLVADTRRTRTAGFHQRRGCDRGRPVEPES